MSGEPPTEAPAILDLGPSPVLPAEGSLDDDSSKILERKKWYIVMGMLSVSGFSFAYKQFNVPQWGIVSSALAIGSLIVALPDDLSRLAPSKAASLTGVLSALGTAIQMCGIFVVYFSDRCTFRFGNYTCC